MNLVDLLVRQKIFSLATFGPGQRVKGVLNHISEELDEIKKTPNDLSEWMDAVLLAFDGAIRQGYTPQEVAIALNDKLTKNEQRDWPDWRNFSESEPIHHVSKPCLDSFSIGDVIRTGFGSTAMMRVDSISENHSGPGTESRYYGSHCMGGTVGAYHSDCSVASENDLKTWRKCRETK